MLAKKNLWKIVFSLAVATTLFVVYQVYMTNVAHTTFERYYAFRGCVSIVDKTDTYGDCKLPNGKTIRIVLINGKWYLDGDGPGVW